MCDPTPVSRPAPAGPTVDAAGGGGEQERLQHLAEAIARVQQSEARLALAQRVAGIGSWEQRFLGEGETRLGPLLWSEETFRIFGHPPDAAADAWALFQNGVHPDDWAPARAAFSAALHTRERYRHDYRIVRPDGTRRVVHAEADFFYDEGGAEKPRRVVGTVQDVTERVFTGEISRHLTEPGELPEMLHRCTQTMVDHLGAALARIWTLDEAADTLELCASSTRRVRLDGAYARVPVGQGKIGRIASERRPHLASHGFADGPPAPGRDWAREHGLVAFAGYPLVVDDRLIGVMAMFSRHALPERTLEAMAAVARHLALGIERKRVEGTVTRLAAIVASSEDAIITKTTEGVITSWNRGAEALFGHAAAEAVGRSCYQLLVPPELVAEESAVLSSIAREQRVPPFETTRMRKGANRIHVSLALSPVTDAAGAVVGVSAIARDITERKRVEAELRASEARYQRIAANVPGMVYQFTLLPDGRYTFPFVSEGCRKIFGLEPAQIQADAWLLLNMMPPKERASFEDSILVSAITLADWDWQGSLMRPGTGEARAVQATSRPERQGNGSVVWDGVLMDVTERNAAEAHRRAKEEAERANAAKSEFLSRMSHELRTPLNAILGFGQLLELHELTDKQHGCVDQIVSGGRHLLKLIDEVLDLASVDSGRIGMSPEPVAVHGLVEETLTLIGPLALPRGIRLEARGELAQPPGPGRGPHVLADRQRFKQVLLNLLSNAVKYNVPGGQVTLDAVLTADRLRLRVTDTGPGIPPEMRARLFTPFDRLGAECSGIEGTGLGLALSKRLMEVMGGELGLEDGPETGSGAAFWVTLPLAKSPLETHKAEAPEPRIEPLPAGRTLLLIEDNLSNLTLIECLMEEYPEVRLITAMDGARGLDLARQQQPELILLDVHLPDLPGWEVLNRLRADGSTRDIPVVVISADATERQVARLMQAGAQAYLTKPLDVRKFLKVVGESLAHRPERDGAAAR